MTHSPRFMPPATCKSLIGLSPPELSAALIESGVPEKSARMRTRQLWNWIYVHGARDFAHPMAHVQNRASLGLQVSEDAEHMLGFNFGQSRRRFVENEEARFFA